VFYFAFGERKRSMICRFKKFSKARDSCLFQFCFFERQIFLFIWLLIRHNATICIMSSIVFTVPAKAKGGEEITVTMPDGQSVVVCLPKNVRPGQKLTVSAPPSVAPSTSQPSPTRNNANMTSSHGRKDGAAVSVCSQASKSITCSPSPLLHSKYNRTVVVNFVRGNLTLLFIRFVHIAFLFPAIEGHFMVISQQQNIFSLLLQSPETVSRSSSASQNARTPSSAFSYPGSRSPSIMRGTAEVSKQTEKEREREREQRERAMKVLESVGSATIALLQALAINEQKRRVFSEWKVRLIVTVLPCVACKQ
jgi:hypothetical protein